MHKTVTERAMMARINRALEREGEGQKLYKTHEHSKNRQELGRFHIVNEHTNRIDAHGIDDLTGLAKDCGTLKAGEVIE